MSILLFFPSAGAPAEILGAAGLTESADTVATTGAVALRSACAVSAASDSLSADGGVALRGEAAIQQGADSLAAASLIALVAEASCLDAEDTVTTWGGTEAQANVGGEPQKRCRRRPMRWIDTKGNEVDLLIDEGGGRHLMVRPTGKKPYKPVRGIRMPRPVGVA